MILTAPLNRVFIEIGPLTIYWYGVIIAVGAGLGLWLAMKEADRLGLNKELLIDFIVYAVPIAIICARIYYVTFEWSERYANGPFWKVFAIWEGGIAIHGAIIGGVLTAIVFSRARKIPFWQLADIVAPSLILAQAIGRWGNFMNQEAHGGPLPDGSIIYDIVPDFIINQMTINGVTYHPTFLYESLWNILIFVLLIILRRYNPLRGEVFLTYVIGYSIGRYFIEGMRTDSLYVIGEWRTAQIVSVIAIVTAILLIIYRRKTTTIRYNDIPNNKKKKG
ncbi:prolipoprotein diacylglyceryl transferase [Oceanobacillus caeni]|uniref:prolipoprotein diacylglyceryl transferase n=1 Tax=Oceanobacillus TaxID=182709 RepID=UPI000621743D|nr:prolipoprotein diacylglyceryl transferase [Oceanobacillus caeni]KKE79652.1 diacylglyceryl transferase [Bacilli bacterium VT-13-104]PZD89634.1 prolipoprotein diacylglyceryl transferase [Bacilli bacterium]MBU8790287.1 prolipoprotein diacylglyceryl transferase [Oceanobacillus caeni]MCR1833395.1 prolipoprotein diacylglyceryl transferase [Oceanobacillus caeni]MED4474690.1 prolipoprotein diacylglyceryl transferase [Oceanobacillus caeni]